MKTKNSGIIVTISMMLIIVLIGCEKTKLTQLDSAVLTSEEISASDDLFDDAIDQADLYENTGVKSLDPSPCAPKVTVTYPESTPFPRVITIDFGTDGCEGHNGVIRKGKIILKVSAPFMQEGSTRSIAFEDYYVNNFKVDGSKSAVYKGLNESQHPYWDITVNGKITTPVGKEITRTSDRKREMVEGFDTELYFWDDVFAITGTASGINSRGNNYTSEITSPIIKARNCRWIESGIVNSTCNEKNIIIDFGDGTCDNKATVTIDGNMKEITLGRRF